MTLIQKMTMENIMSYLLREEIVSTQDSLDIQAKIGVCRQVEKFLLEILPKQDILAYTKLIEVLLEIGDHEIANLLLDSNGASSLTGDFQMCLVCDTIYY